MKILQIAPHFPPNYVGGVEQYTRRVSDWLAAHDHVPTVICIEHLDEALTGRVSGTVDSTSGYEVHRLSVNLGAGRDPFLSSYRDLAIEDWLAAFFENARPDVVHLHSGYLLGGAALSAARECRIPVVVTVHDFWFICPRVTLLQPSGSCCSGPDSPAKCAWCLRTERRRFRWPDRATGGALGRAMVELIRKPAVARTLGWRADVARVSSRSESLLRMLEQADAILVPSEFVRNMVARQGVATDRMAVFRYGLDGVDTDGPIATRRPGPLRLGYMSQVAPHKGLHVLIAAVRGLQSRPLELRVYGQLDREPAYVARLRRSAGRDRRIVFAGAYEHSRVARVLSDLDVIVVPSIWYENSPFVIHEAFAARVPVVASRLGGMSELIEDGRSGLLFQVGSVKDLARQIERLLDDPALVPRLRAGIPPVRAFDEEMNDLDAVYRRVVDTPASCSEVM